MLTRREALRTLGASALAGLSAQACAAQDASVELNDVQSQLNATRVKQVVKPTTLDQLQAELFAAQRFQQFVSLAGGRHAMGGQQFAKDSLHLDLTGLKRVLSFDKERGLLEVEAGIMWPELMDYLQKEQVGVDKPWAIRQKQTGVDNVTIAGTMSANAHARGLRFKPFIDDVESFTLLDAAGKLHTCSRSENKELFGLAIGGYGLFGIITSAKLRLTPRRKVQRVVEVIAVKDLAQLVEERVKAGFLYGDCQYSTSIAAGNAQHPGVFSCYKPNDDAPPPKPLRKMSEEDWQRMYVLARTDKQKAFDAYAQYYLSTNNQVYWSDLHQMAGNFDIRNLQEALVQAKGNAQAGTEMITEVYVRPDDLLAFLKAAQQDIAEHHIDLTYGTIRFIERDDESFLAWAKDRQICILCNLHVAPGKAGQEKAASDLRRLIGRALEFNGRYYLTYHRWATREQVTKAYPQLVDFLKLKKKYDPRERFQSAWYQHYKAMYADKLS